MPLHFGQVIPVLRIFDIAKADEFYQGFLGFTLDWEHRFDDNAPLYRQVSRGTLVLQLSEHHGDGTPGTHVRVMMQGLDDYHREIAAKNYRYYRPGIETMPWNTREMVVYDPFGNRIYFCEPAAPSAA
jgi:catechol 2,3-dioxygenase-like lactoylglutathione lyase family enzyme